MASPRCGTGADPFASLPLDLVAHLLSYIRLRPRLRVLALVSRRWRDAVTRTITSLTPAAPAELLAHPRLTRLRKAHDRHCHLVGPVSPALLDLKFEPPSVLPMDPMLDDEPVCGCAHLNTVTSLTRLHLKLPERRCCDESLNLLQHNVGITDLVLHTTRGCLQRIPSLASLRLPRLRSLSIGGIPDADEFVAAHAAQLTALTAVQSLILRLRLPQCVSLGLLTADSLNRDFQAAIAALAPRLQSLRVLCAVTVPVSRLLDPVLRAVCVAQARSSVSFSLHPLARLEHLKTAARLAYLRQAPFLSSLHSLTMAPSSLQISHDQSDLIFALTVATQLRSLTIRDAIVNPTPIASLRFPHLRRLSLLFTHCPLEVVALIVSDAAPLLEHLTYSPHFGAELRPPLDLLRLAERRGVRKVVLVSDRKAWKRPLLAHLPQFRWLTVRLKTRARPSAIDDDED